MRVLGPKKLAGLDGIARTENDWRRRTSVIGKVTKILCMMHTSDSGVSVCLSFAADIRSMHSGSNNLVTQSVCSHQGVCAAVVVIGIEIS